MINLFYKKILLLFFCALILSATSLYAQNVGIGTTNPRVPLHIKADDEALRIQGSEPWIGLTNNTADSTTYDGFVYFPDTSLVLGSRSGTNMPVILAPNNVGVLYATPSGDVGIGTGSPTQNLDVNGTVRIRGGNPASGAVLTSDASGNASWQTVSSGALVDTISIVSAHWLQNGQYSFQTSPSSYITYTSRYVDIPISQLTAAFLNGGGSVQLFFTSNLINNGYAWSPMPFSILDASGNFYYKITYETFQGKIRLHYFFEQINLTATPPTLSTYNIPTYHFKIVLTQGTLID